MDNEYPPAQQYPPAQPVGYTQPPGTPPYPPQQPYPQQPGYPYGPQYPQPYPPQPVAKTSYGLCVLAAAVWSVVLVVLMFAVAGPPGSAEAFGRYLGAQAVPCLLAALATWLIFKRRKTNFLILVAVALPFYFIVFLLVTAGRTIG